MQTVTEIVDGMMAAGMTAQQQVAEMYRLASIHETSADEIRAARDSARAIERRLRYAGLITPDEVAALDRVERAAEFRQFADRNLAAALRETAERTARDADPAGADAAADAAY